VFGYCLLGLHRYRTTLLVNLSVLVFSGVLTGVLASRGGATGAATSVVIVEVVYALLLGWAVWQTGARPGITPTIVPRAFLAAGLGALALVPPHLPGVVRPILALLIYASALLAMRAVPREILEQLALLRRRALP
jgi:O-antigen/teichoic acid export membrane protein